MDTLLHVTIDNYTLTCTSSLYSTKRKKKLVITCLHALHIYTRKIQVKMTAQDL